VDRLGFEAYRDLVLEELDLEVPEGVGPEATLDDDLGMDSFNVFELIVLTEQLAELDVPPAELPPLVSLGDAHAYYLAACDSALSESEN